MEVKTLLNMLKDEVDRQDDKFLEADREYHKANRQNDKNSMAYWWTIENMAHLRGDDIRNAIRIIKEFTEEGLC